MKTNAYMQTNTHTTHTNARIHSHSVSFSATVNSFGFERAIKNKHSYDILTTSPKSMHNKLNSTLVMTISL